MLGDIDVVWVVGECLTKVVNIKYVLNIHKSWTFSGFSEGQILHQIIQKLQKNGILTMIINSEANSTHILEQLA